MVQPIVATLYFPAITQFGPFIEYQLISLYFNITFKLTCLMF